MKSPFFIAAFLIATIYAEKPPPFVTLRCELRSDKTVYKKGELPKLQVEIVNDSKKDIYLIGSLDGSFEKWRFPYCYFTLEGPIPKTNRLLECAMMNTIRIADFKSVKAGKHFDPYQHVDEYGYFPDPLVSNQQTFKNPGVYKIKFYYSTTSQNIKDYVGSKPFNRDNYDSLKINLLFQKVPKVDIASNEIEITITE